MQKPKSKKKQPKLSATAELEDERDKGGRILAKKIWRVFNFVVEVAVESPGDISEEEAAEDAAEFITVIGRATGRVHSSFASVTRTDEYGAHRPDGAVVFTRPNPTGTKAELQLPRGVLAKPVKEKPQKAKAKKKKKSTAKRF